MVTTDTKPKNRRVQERMLAVAVVLPIITCACSIKKIAINSLGSALAEGSSVYERDDDPELVGDAIPFGLKTIEALLEESPRNRKLLLAAASGFTQYAYGWVHQEADFVEDLDLDRATAMRRRAARLYLRARDYGLRGLDMDGADFRRRLAANPEEAIRGMKLEKKRAPLLYWTGMAWFGAISLSRDNSELTADQYVAKSLIDEALRLNESFDHGAIHDFYISWESRGDAVGGSIARARKHFARAVELSDGHRAQPFVSLAECVAVSRQNRREFETLLNQALEIGLDRLPDARLNNVLFQRRARWLLNRADELFIE
jgi:predicted anti-sigma-YlaC factor YlaD